MSSPFEPVAADTAVPDLLAWFTYSHLPSTAQNAAGPCHDLARHMAATVADNAQLRHGLWLLLMAKDAFVRAALGTPPGANT